jgi:inhibitor of growth protein 3
VANLPAEISHLFEEIQAKELKIQECRKVIEQRDNSIQKNVKINGGLVPHPKEVQYTKTILENYDRAEALQEEKIQLTKRAEILVGTFIHSSYLALHLLQPSLCVASICVIKSSHTQCH